MIMEKTFKRLIMLFSAFVLCFSVYSCGGDDDDVSPSTGNGSSIVQNLMKYKWTGQFTSYDTWSQGVSEYTQTFVIYFTSSTEGVMHLWTRDRDSALGTSRYEEHIDFSYSVVGSKIILSGGSNLTFDYYGDYMMSGYDKFTPNAMTSEDYSYLRDHQNGYHGKNGEISADIVFEYKYRGANDLGNGWYTYTMEYRIGATEDAYKKGVTQMRITMWSDKGTLQSGFKTSDYGKKRTFTYSISSSDLVWRDMNLICSKERSITLNYEVEYYNSNDKGWYTQKSGKETLYVN